MYTQKGFVHIVVIIAALVALGAGGYFISYYKQNKMSSDLKLETEINHRDQDISTNPFSSQKQYEQTTVGLFGQQCQGTGTIELKTFPLEPKNIELITPMGRVQDSHVTPTDHQYIVPVGTESGSLITSDPKKYQIKSPADGYIVTIEL